MVVLQQNTTEFRWGTIIEDIEVFTQVHGLDPKHRLLFLEQINQWLGVLGTHTEWRRPTYHTIEYFAHRHD